MTDEQNSGEVIEWLPVAEAAEVLGIARRSVYRRVEKKTIDFRTDEDGRLLVAVTESQKTGVTSHKEPVTKSQKTSADAVKIAVLEERLAGQQKMIEYLDRQNENLINQNEQLNQELLAALSKIPRLEAGDTQKPEPEAQPPEPEPSPPESKGWRQALADWIAGK